MPQKFRLLPEKFNFLKLYSNLVLADFTEKLLEMLKMCLFGE